MKFLGLLLILSTTIINDIASQEDEEAETVAVELQLADYDLSDAFDEVSEATQNAVLGNGFEDKVIAEQDRAKLMRTQSEKNRNLEGDLPYDLVRNWTLLTKTGDFLLPEAHYNSLVVFHNANEQLSSQAKVSCLPDNSTNTTCTIGKQGYLDLLATSRNSTYLNETWKAWQEIFVATQPQFNSTLQSVNEAFIPNGQHSARSYWEMLSEYENGYEKAQQLWQEVQPLYKKLQNFVKSRLDKYYNLTQNESAIPIYLLGSDLGTDWSNIADIILPHPYLYDEVVTELKYYTTKEVYQLAENATKTMGLGPLGKHFWTKSDFNFSSCGPHIFSNCYDHYTELLTCKKLGWTEYLDIHEAAINVALRNADYFSLPRREVRFSAIDEALQGLGSIIAVNNLPVYQFVPEFAFKNETNGFNRKDTSLLLMALRFLPRIPYYLLADTWRLEELEFSYGGFAEKWWEKRNDMQGLRGNTNLEPDFLADAFISSNKPHLSKFLAVFLQFQLLDHFQKYFNTENGTIASFIGGDVNFMSFIKDRPNKDWPNLASYHYGIEEISSAALLEYFQPLEAYLESAPMEQVRFSTTPKPKPTKPTKKPISRKPRIKPVAKMEIVANETPSPVQSDDHHKVKKVEPRLVGPNTSEAPKTVTTQSASSEKLYVLSGIAGVVCVGVLIVIIVRRLKRKRRSNNRRFET